MPCKCLKPHVPYIPVTAFKLWRKRTNRAFFDLGMTRRLSFCNRHNQFYFGPWLLLWLNGEEAGTRESYIESFASFTIGSAMHHEVLTRLSLSESCWRKMWSLQKACPGNLNSSLAGPCANRSCTTVKAEIFDDQLFVGINFRQI